GNGAGLVGSGTGGAVRPRRRPQPERIVRASVGVVAKPPIRKLARDLGVDLADVSPTGPAGEVTREDVLGHASQASVFRNIETPEWPDVREESIPVPVVTPSEPVALGGEDTAAPAPGEGWEPAQFSEILRA